MKNTDATEQAIRSLYEQHANDIYRYARVTLGDGTAAKDVVQEVFLRAYRHWDSFRQESNPKTWLMTIARNHIYDLFRKKRKEHKSLMDYHSLNNASDPLAQLETTLILEEALAQLKDSYRHVFTLRHVQRYSVEETSRLLGWSQSKVRITDHRAIAKLRGILGLSFQEVNRQ